jgi:fermentation-respiration switch protein FrsA (DUF1100 family)
MNAHDVHTGFSPLVPATFEPQHSIPARLVPKMALLRPGAYASKIECPVLFAICGKDTVAPPKPTLKFAQRAPKGVIKYYEDMGHFDIYVGEKHDRAFKDYKEFLQTNLPA